MVHKIIQYFSQSTDILKNLVILIVLSWESIGFSDETIKPPTTLDNSLAPALSYYGTKTRMKFNDCCLKQGKTAFTHGKQ